MFSLTNPDTRRDAVEGSRQMVWFFELLQYLKNSEHPMFSWSCEQVPPARNALLRLEEQGDIPKIPAFIKKAMLHDEVLTAADFGSCQIRRRLFFGEGFTPRKRQHIEWRTVGDVLPHLRAEHDRAIADGTWDANFSQVAGEIDEEGEAWLRKGSVCLMGSIIPGKGGCSWNEDTKGRGFAYCYDFSSQTVSLMHHPPSLTYVRFLTLEETLTLAGFPSTYQFPPSVGNKDRYQMIGNAVCPAVAAGVFKGLKTTDDWWF
jgi:site-specific DNA-cytosine methylase